MRFYPTSVAQTHVLSLGIRLEKPLAKRPVVPFLLEWVLEAEGRPFQMTQPPLSEQGVAAGICP